MMTFHELKIPSHLWPCLFYIYLVKFIWKAIDMQICPDLSLHISTCSSWPTSVKPIFPAWKALRVNSPASAGLMPGTLPEKHTQAHTQNENINTCMRHGQGVRHTLHIHTHKQTEIKMQGQCFTQGSFGMKTDTSEQVKEVTFSLFSLPFFTSH